MAELLTVFILQLLFGIFRPCLLQRTSAGLRSVHPGDNITLHCDITVEYDIWWYHQNSEEMKLLITARKGKLGISFSLNYNLNEDHYDGIMKPGSVDLVIVGVNETDLGLYYCGGRNNTNHIQFGKAIRLNFTGGDLQSNSSSAHTDSKCSSPDPAPCQITIVVLGSVCLISVLTNFIMFCNRVQGENFLIDLIQNQCTGKFDASDAIAEDSTEKCPPCECHCSAENDPPPTPYLLYGGPVGVLTIEEQGNTGHR
ncbi:hypothetical protein NFI96_013740 [Prochilodus magdalenae]|nr:hypothetical protein NFI96_013740 [Prochilodus magdalenae]